jgi:SpoVK/Ycf46/Vps4 family AAA+-type ATPase
MIQLIIKKLIETQNGIVFKIESANDVKNYTQFMKTTFKCIEPNRRIVTIIEDIDGLLQSGKETETILLNILDGMNQMDNIVYVATTNYPEELSERLLNRPSRFDRRYPITLPNEEVRKYYIENVMKPDDLAKIDIDEWVRETKDFSIAHLHELIVSTVILNNSFEKSIKIMKEFNTIKPNSAEFKKFGNKGKIGFSNE